MAKQTYQGPKPTHDVASGEAENWLTSAEAARRIGVDNSTLCMMRREGRGPAYHRPQRHVRYRPEDVDAFIRSVRVEGGA